MLLLFFESPCRTSAVLRGCFPRSGTLASVTTQPPNQFNLASSVSSSAHFHAQLAAELSETFKSIWHKPSNIDNASFLIRRSWPQHVPADVVTQSNNIRLAPADVVAAQSQSAYYCSKTHFAPALQRCWADATVQPRVAALNRLFGTRVHVYFTIACCAAHVSQPLIVLLSCLYVVVRLCFLCSAAAGAELKWPIAVRTCFQNCVGKRT